MGTLRIGPRVAVCVVYVAAVFMSIMDGTIVNVALPTLSREFGISTASIDVIVVAYLVSLAVAIPASGWVGDRWGTKRTFLSALTLFTLASALCGLSQSVAELVGARILQGIAGGLLTPVGTTMLFRAFPPAERVQLSRILTVPTVIAPATGPVLGGFLVDRFSWHWVFFVNMPIGLAAVVFGLLFLHEQRETNTGRFDWRGLLLSGIGFALVMYALSEGPAQGWLAPTILTSGGIGLLVLAGLVWLELRIPDPIVDLRLFGNNLFRTANLVMLFGVAGFIGVLFLVPLFLQEARGNTALASGLATFPEAIGVIISTQLVARLYPRVGPRRLMAGGLTGVAIAIALLCLVDIDTNVWIIRLLMFLIGAGMAYVFLPVQTAAFATIAPAETGRASVLFSAQNQIGSALGVALVSSVLAAVSPTRVDAGGVVSPYLMAYYAAFITAALLALIAAAFALMTSDRDAASTMQPRLGTEGEQVPVPVGH